MNRETKTFVTSGTTTIEYYAYLTAKEAKQLESEMLSRMTINIDGAGNRTSSITADILNASQDKAIKMLIVSVNGDKQNAFERVENLPAQEYFEIVKELNPVVAAAIDPSFLAKPSTPASA